MKIFKQRPADGGSYQQSNDGTWTQLEAPTAPCPRKSDVAAAEAAAAAPVEPATDTPRQARARKTTEE